MGLKKDDAQGVDDIVIPVLFDLQVEENMEIVKKLDLAVIGELSQVGCLDSLTSKLDSLNLPNVESPKLYSMAKPVYQ